MKPRHRLSLVGYAIILFIIGHSTPIWSQQARVERLSGTAQVQLTPTETFRNLTQSESLPPEAFIKTGPNGLVRITYNDGVTVTVKPNATVQVGGTGGEGAHISKGNVVVRAKRLISSGLEKTFRTPIAVAAIRGTEFGISVDETSRSSVYVFEGKVAVSNAQIPNREVMVKAGEMTVVEPLHPPTPPATFQSGEFDQLGRLDALERGEDPVLESSEEPVDGSYLAFPDSDIDALRNPAYTATISKLQSTTALSIYGLHKRDNFKQNNAQINLSRQTGRGIVGHHVTLIPLNQQLKMGVSARGSKNTNTADRVTQTPIPWATEKRHQKTNSQIGELQTMLAQDFGTTKIGAGVTYRTSDITVWDTPLSKGLEEKTTTDNRLAEVQAGLHLGQTTKNIGIKFAHQDLKSTIVSGTLYKEFNGYNNILETLVRNQIEDHFLAGLLRIERTKTNEFVNDNNLPVYTEDRTVWASKGGAGWGTILHKSIVVSLDLLGGISKETATQYLPNGGIREDERDWRFSLSTHIGTQIHLGKSLLLTLDATHLIDHQRMNFDILPNSPSPTQQQQIITQATTSAITGIGYMGKNMVLEYFISSPINDQPFAHNLLLIVELFQ